MDGVKSKEHVTAERTTASPEGNRKFPTPMATISEEELIRIEFYKTYDVMTGIRIAATLGGFFSMMILLVLYKNYCKPSKSLSEEQLNAAVSAAVEEEDRALAAALEATSFYSSLSKQRQSLGSISGPSSQPRFSNSGPTPNYTPTDCQYEPEEDDMPCEGEDEPGDRLPEYYACSYLNVPIDRRASSITCSSGDSSYLERRGSAFEMGHPVPPCCHRLEKKKLPVADDPWDFYYPIDIQVIQPTPQLSPTTSEHTLYEEVGVRNIHGLQVPTNQDRMHRLTVDRSEIGLAPLASISSLGSFSSNASPMLSGIPRKPIHDEDLPEESQGSDSVFVEGVDTEDEVDEFETDSEFEDGFDDDYSFCETTRRPISRCEKQARFASFDSCDMSIVADTDIIDEEEARDVPKPGPRGLRRQYSAQDGAKPKRKLTKTASEPRHVKQLPAWIERGRSGFVPKRQLSMPASSRRKAEPCEPAKEQIEEVKNAPRPPQPLPCSESSSDSPTLTQFEEANSQGTHSEMPSTERRARFQKQKTIFEGGLAPSQLLAPPAVKVYGSCERLNQALSAPMSPTVFSLSIEGTTDVMLSSRSSSQETLC